VGYRCGYKISHSGGYIKSLYVHSYVYIFRIHYFTSSLDLPLVYFLRDLYKGEYSCIYKVNTTIYIYITYIHTYLSMEKAGVTKHPQEQVMPIARDTGLRGEDLVW
jgi:hypothetical protein